MTGYINLLMKPASGICNMKCDYCFYCDETKKRTKKSYGMMNEETLKNIVRKSIMSATYGCTIGFQGGEPTLCGLDFYRKAVRFCEQYNQNKIPLQFTLQTNGYEVSKEWCEFFVNHNFLVGLSVDGTRNTHDIYRHLPTGEKTYDKIMETVKLFDTYKVQYNVLTVVHKETARNINQIYKAYQNQNFQYLQFIACLDPLGEMPGKRGYSLTPEMYGEFLCSLFDLWYCDYKNGCQPYIRQFENYIGILAGYRPESCEQIGTCSRQYVVEADGSVYPCDFYALDEYCIGNFNRDSLYNIEKNRETIGFLQRSHNHSDSCKACKWYGLCRGGCYRNREQTADNYFCKSYQMFFEHAYERLIRIVEGLIYQ